MSKLPNLRYVGRQSDSVLKLMRSAEKRGMWSEKIKTTRRKIVDRAIEKYASKETIEQIHSKRRSDASTQRLIDDFMSFEQPEHKVIRDKHYNRALRVTAELFRPKRKLKPIHYTNQRYYPWTLNTSAEAPWSYKSEVTDIIRQKQAEGLIQDGRRSFHNLYDEIFTTNRHLIHKIKDGDPQFWTPDGTPIPYEFTNLHARAHVVDEDEPDKIRAVFGVTKLLLMAEQHFIWPLQETYLNGKTESPLLWGNEMIKGGWRKLWNDAYKKAPFNTVLSTDWSQFDKRALHEVIDDVTQIWRDYFTFEEGYIPNSLQFRKRGQKRRKPVTPERLERLWKWTNYCIKHTPICLPNGDMYVWERNGIASGFQRTQLLDTFVDCVMSLTLYSKLGIDIESKNFWIKIQGDDNIVAFPEPFHQLYGNNFLRRLAELALLYFNAKLSEKKSQISNDLNNVKVLGYQNQMMMPYRTDADLLSHLRYPERSFGLPELASSSVGIAWATLGCSKVVFFVCKESHHFLVDKLGVKPNFQANQWMYTLGLDPIEQYNIERFPTFEEIYATAFSIDQRSEKLKERLYPTKPESAGGFYFIPY